MTKLKSPFTEKEYNESLERNIDNLKPTYLGDLSIIMKDIISDECFKKPLISGEENGYDITLSLIKSSSVKLVTDIKNLIGGIFNDLYNKKIELNLSFNHIKYDFEYIELYNKILNTTGSIDKSYEILDMLSLGYTSAILSDISTNLYASNFKEQMFIDNILNREAPNVNSLIYRHLLRCLEYVTVFHL